MKIQFTEEQIQQVLNESMPELKNAVINEFKASCSWEAREEARKLVQQYITKFVKEEIIPEMAGQLAASKEGLTSLGVAVAPLMVEEIAKAMGSIVKERLESSYTRKQIFEALFQ